MSALTCVILVALAAGGSAAQETSAAVEFNQQLLFRVFAPLGRNSPQGRATLIREHLGQFALDGSTPLESLRLVETAGATEIHAGRHYLLAVTEQDATAAAAPGHAWRPSTSRASARACAAIAKTEVGRIWLSAPR
ncbi:MAG: hypothetical protein ACKV22_05480 [Bryobacteraceae bacterium]